MVPVILIILTIFLTIVCIANKSKFVKSGKINETCKQVDLRTLLTLIPKLVYYGYIAEIPNYEAAQRILSTLGNNIRGRIPFGSTDYQGTADPVYAKRIMADPKWTERVPVGHYIQDAGFYKPYGILFGGGRYWKSTRQITTKLLQQLGFFNPTTMEGRFVFEMEELERKLDVKLALNGGEHTFCPRDIFSYLSINVVFHILLGKRNPFDKAVVSKLVSSIMTSNIKISQGLALLEIMPFLRHFPKLTFMKYWNETSNLVYGIFRQVIAEKRRTGKYKEHVEDFVDGFLQHLDKSEGREDGLNEENMLVVLRDMLFAGSDTTRATIEHALLFMALHPEVQEKVQAEIDDVIGPERTPSYDDRRRMPYTEATLNETYRISSTVPAVVRAKHEGKNCSVALIHFYGINRNESFYDEPNEFMPERFLDKDDPFKVINNENLMPFGYGRRSCPAEIAARVAVFIFFVVMLQKYWIKLSSQHPPPSLKSTHGISRSPLNYYITIRRRR